MKTKASTGISGESLVRDRWSRRRVTVVLATPPEGALTQQQFKDECDMNNIVKRAQRGIPPRFLNNAVPQYGDFSNVPDLTTAYDVIERAQSAFMNLPAELRRELDNDPANINRLTVDQIQRYGLSKHQASTSPSQPAPGAGQAQQGGTEPPVSTEGGSKKSVKTDG